MSNLVTEILLRLIKPAAAVLLGAILFWILTDPLRVRPSVELGLLCWLSGAAFIVLTQESPI